MDASPGSDDLPIGALLETVLSRHGSEPGDAVASARAGLGADAAATVAAAMGIPVPEMRRMVGADGDGPMGRVASGALLRVAEAWDALCWVFGDPAVARQWLAAPCAALGGSEPWRLCDTGPGCRLIEEAAGAERLPGGISNRALLPAGELPRRVADLCGGVREGHAWMRSANHALGGHSPASLSVDNHGRGRLRRVVDAVLVGGVP